MKDTYAGREFERAGYQHDKLNNEPGIYIVFCKERPRIILYLGQSDKVRDHVESRNTECWERYCPEHSPFVSPFIYYVYYTNANEDERLAIMKEVKKELGNVRCNDEDATS